MPYVWNKDLNDFTHYDPKYIVEDKDYEDFYKKYESKLENEEGYAYFEDGKLVYEERKVLILINKEMGYYSLTESAINDDIYMTKEISYTDYLKYEKERNNNKIVVFKNNNFKVIQLKKDEIYDYKEDKISIDYNARRNRILGDTSLNTILEEIKRRGFRFTFNNIIYYQPFRDINDKFTFIAAKAISPNERIIKLYTNRSDKGNSKYEILKGSSISDDFLSKMLKDYQVYESFTKKEVEDYLKELNKLTEIEDLVKFKNEYIDKILELVMTKYGK